MEKRAYYVIKKNFLCIALFCSTLTMFSSEHSSDDASSSEEEGGGIGLDLLRAALGAVQQEQEHEELAEGLIGRMLVAEVIALKNKTNYLAQLCCEALNVPIATANSAIDHTKMFLELSDEEWGKVVEENQFAKQFKEAPEELQKSTADCLIKTPQNSCLLSLAIIMSDNQEECESEEAREKLRSRFLHFAGLLPEVKRALGIQW